MSMPDTDAAASSDAAEQKPKLSLDVKVEKPGACQRHVTVTVSREDVDRYFKEAFDELLPKAEVPGFRPGRAPRKLVESKFRDRVSDQVKGSLLMDSMTQVNEDHEFSAISEPDLDFEAIEIPSDGPLTFEFDVEVRPDFDMPEWKGLELEKPVRDFSDEDVDQQLKSLLHRYGKTETVDGAVEEGDQVTLNATFKLDGRVVSKMREQTVRVKPTLSFRDGKLEGFADLLKGAKKGDHVDGKVTLSDEADDEELRGKEVDAHFEIVEVKRVQLPELNAEFLDSIGGFEDESALREAVRSELERQLAYHRQQRIREQITTKLIATADWELPPDTLRRQSHRELHRAVMELQSAGFSEDAIRAHENELRQNSQRSTAKALKEHFILERIAEDQEIEADQQDYDREIMVLAHQTNESPRRVRAQLEKRGQMDSLRNQIIERKVIDLITEHAQFTEVPFEHRADDVAAVAFAISGQRGEGDIPEARPGGGEASELREPADHS